jgi:PAS domain S-box-containing protein
MFAYRSLSTPPGFVVVVGQDKDAILSAWRPLAGVAVSIWSAASAAIVLLSILLSRSGRQRLRVEQGQTRMFDRITDAFVAMDRHWVCVYANQHAAEMLGCDLSVLIGKNIWHQFSGDAPSQIRDACERSMAAQVPSQLEEYYPPLGRWLESRLYPSPQEMTIYFQDVSARKQGELTLQQLSRRVLEAQETERRRVAHELHDELGQSLTAIKINLQSQTLFRQQPATEIDTENIRIVEDAIQQVRRLALALRPSVLDDLGLLPALRWMTEQNAARMAVVVDLDPALEDVRFPPEIETAFFRIAQETLTNIARYAHARHVGIRLQREGAILELRIEDDGCGFDVADMRKRALAGASMGVLGMQERATLVGGTLDIRSAPGQGCTITLRCPWQLLQELE